MKHKLSTIFVVAISLAACAKSLTPSEQLAQRAEKETADSLKDPTSAKFKDVIASVHSKCVSGKILAKNSMGAYTGYHDFVWANGKLAINAEQDEILDKTDYLSQMNAYMDISGPCIAAAIHDTSSDSQAHIPDT